MRYFYDVSPSRPLMDTLTYFSLNKLELGMKVVIPIGKSKCDGFIVADSKDIDGVELKEIEKHSEQSYFSKKNLEFYIWVSKYYHYPLGEILAGVNPKFVAIYSGKTNSLCNTISKTSDNNETITHKVALK